MAPDLNKVRNELPAALDAVYLNTGSYGPLSRAAAAAIEEANNQQLNGGRLNFSVGEANQATASALRSSFARVLGCADDEVALTHHTTDGMNIATWGVQYRPGDEIVTNSWPRRG